MEMALLKAVRYLVILTGWRFGKVIYCRPTFPFAGPLVILTPPLPFPRPSTSAGRIVTLRRVGRPMGMNPSVRRALLALTAILGLYVGSRPDRGQQRRDHHPHRHPQPHRRKRSLLRTLKAVTV